MGTCRILTIEVTPATVLVTADSHEWIIAVKDTCVGDPEPALTYQAESPVAGETPAFSGELSREPGAERGGRPIERPQHPASGCQRRRSPHQPQCPSQHQAPWNLGARFSNRATCASITSGLAHALLNKRVCSPRTVS